MHWKDHYDSPIERGHGRGTWPVWKWGDLLRGYCNLLGGWVTGREMMVIWIRATGWRQIWVPDVFWRESRRDFQYIESGNFGSEQLCERWYTLVRWQRQGEEQSWVGVGCPDVLIIIPAKSCIITSSSSASRPPPLLQGEILVPPALLMEASLVSLSTTEFDPLLN